MLVLKPLRPAGFEENTKNLCVDDSMGQLATIFPLFPATSRSTRVSACHGNLPKTDGENRINREGNCSKQAVPICHEV